MIYSQQRQNAVRRERKPPHGRPHLTSVERVQHKGAGRKRAPAPLDHISHRLNADGSAAAGRKRAPAASADVPHHSQGFSTTSHVFQGFHPLLDNRYIIPSNDGKGAFL